jgi:hypothetical protein
VSLESVTGIAHGAPPRTDDTGARVSRPGSDPGLQELASEATTAAFSITDVGIEAPPTRTDTDPGAKLAEERTRPGA